MICKYKIIYHSFLEQCERISPFLLVDCFDKKKSLSEQPIPILKTLQEYVYKYKQAGHQDTKMLHS